MDREEGERDTEGRERERGRERVREISLSLTPGAEPCSGITIQCTIG